MRAKVDLGDDEVHVWTAFLDTSPGSLDRLARTLSADEWERAHRFHFEADRRRFVARRGIRRSILARYAGREPDRLQFMSGTYGKPELAGDAICFNCSESGGLALYALTRGLRIGVDVERLRPFTDACGIARSFFAPPEHAALCTLPPGDRDEALLRCRSCKEAYVKARGEGLARSLDNFVVTLAADGSARLEQVDADPRGAAGWSLASSPRQPATWRPLPRRAAVGA
jgi:4'-phosphopantetheinyl transferase